MSKSALQKILEKEKKFWLDEETDSYFIVKRLTKSTYENIANIPSYPENIEKSGMDLANMIVSEMIKESIKELKCLFIIPFFDEEGESCEIEVEPNFEDGKLDDASVELFKFLLDEYHPQILKEMADWQKANQNLEGLGLVLKKKI